MLNKICGKCGKKILQGSKCNCKGDKLRHKIYDRVYRNKESASFYNSKEWRKLSNLCKVKANGLDMYELVINKRIVKGTLAHHIQEITENKSRALDITNFIWISAKTHTMIHNEYNKSSEDKKRMQGILYGIVGRVNI